MAFALSFMAILLLDYFNSSVLIVGACAVVLCTEPHVRDTVGVDD